MDCSTPGFSVHHQLPELAQTHVHLLMMPSNHLILSSPSPPTFNISRHQGLFQWVSSLHQVVKVLKFQHQGKSEVVKQEMARVNIDILGISELKWTRIGEFNSDNHYIYYCGQESLRRNGVALIVNKSLKMQFLGAVSKMTEWTLFGFKMNHSIPQ